MYTVQVDKLEGSRCAQRGAATSSRLQLLQCCRTTLIVLCGAVAIYTLSSSYGRIQLQTRPLNDSLAGDDEQPDLGVFVLVDLATKQPNTATRVLRNCSEVTSVLSDLETDRIAAI